MSVPRRPSSLVHQPFFRVFPEEEAGTSVYLALLITSCKLFTAWRVSLVSQGRAGKLVFRRRKWMAFHFALCHGFLGLKVGDLMFQLVDVGRWSDPWASVSMCQHWMSWLQIPRSKVRSMMVLVDYLQKNVSVPGEFPIVMPSFLSQFTILEELGFSFLMLL